MEARITSRIMDDGAVGMSVERIKGAAVESKKIHRRDKGSSFSELREAANKGREASETCDRDY